MRNKITRKPINALLVSTALCAVSFGLFPMAANAQTLYWDGSDTTSGNGAPVGGAGTWDAATNNWTNNAAGTTNEAWAIGADAIFGGATGGFVELDGDQVVDDITFDTSGYEIGDTPSFSPDNLVTNSSSTFTMNEAATVSADIVGTGFVAVTGPGMLTLSGSNSQAGGLILSNASVTLAHDDAAGAGDILTQESSIHLSDTVEIFNNIEIIGDYDTSFIQNGGSATLGGDIFGPGTGSFIKDGTGEIILTGTNIYAGDTIILDGTLRALGGTAINDLGNVNISGASGVFRVDSSETIGSLAGSGTVIIDSGQELTTGGNNNDSVFSGLIGNSGAQFRKIGSGNMTLSGDNNLFTLFTVDGAGSTITATGANLDATVGISLINGGTLIADNAGNNAIEDSVHITTIGTSTFEVRNDETIGNFSGSGNVFLNGADLTYGNSSNFLSYGVISGTGGLIKQGIGTSTLTGVNTYTGSTIVNDGIFSITGSIASTDINVNGAQLYVEANAFASDADIDLNSGAYFENDGYNTIGAINTTTGTTIDLTAGGLTTGNAGNQEIAGTISGTGYLVKLGAGILSLSGSNDFSGGITLAGGTLSLQNDNAAGTGTITTTGSVIDYANGVNIANPININSNTTQVQVLAGSAEQSGIISETAGPRPLEKIGAGELIFSGANTYTGLTTISAGTLSLNGGAAIADSASVATGAGGTLNIMASETIAAMNNAGIINLTNGAVGNNLTIAGDYTGAGVINIDVNFGTDTADQLIVGGNVTGGATNIVVTDISTSAATGNDILVVDVAGTSNAGDFVLVGTPVISGAFSYVLEQTGMDWFLGQALSPLTATYEIYPQALSALNSLSTMRQRTNSRVYSDGEERDGVVWGIVEASHALVSPQSSTTASTFETNAWKMTAGMDGVIHIDDRGQFAVGANISYGSAGTNIFSGTGNGSIFTQGVGAGLTGTWFGAEGFYVDGQLQIGWTFSDLNSAATGVLTNDNFGQTYALSLEAGQQFDIGDGLVLTPNAQLAYSLVQFTGFSGGAGENVSLDHGNSLVARVGVNIEKEQAWVAEDGTNINSSMYGLANIYYDFSGGSQVDVAGTKLLVQPYHWSAEVVVGGSHAWENGKYLLTGEIALSSGSAGFSKSYQVRGNLGFSANF